MTRTDQAAERERNLVRHLTESLEAAERGELVDDERVWEEVDRVLDSHGLPPEPESSR